MPSKLYVGNLAWSVTSDDLEEAFSEAGQVISANVVTDKSSGQSRGFGFVEMGSAEEAAAAIEMLTTQYSRAATSRSTRRSRANQVSAVEPVVTEAAVQAEALASP